MPKNYIIVTGKLIDRCTIELDEAIPIETERVRLTVEPVSSSEPRAWKDVLVEIHRRQAARGHRSPTAEEVDLHLQSERDSWDD
jgi:hypothetical protein